jgi:putative ABC transport system permease protein
MTKEMLAPQTRKFLPEQDVYDLAVSLVTIDPEHYEELCQQAGVPLGSNILINQCSQIIEGKITVFTPIIFSNQTVCLTSKYGEPTIELALHGQLSIGEIPSEVLYACRGYLNVLIPRGDMISYYWFADTKNIDGFTEYANTILYEMIPPDSESRVGVKVLNIEEIKDTMNNVSRLIMIFIYSFVGLLTLIGVTNIISTISTNVRSRSRELAVLRSVGMTYQGLNRMLGLESVICSAQSLIFGLPIGIAASWLIYHLMISAEFEYEFPWLAVAECIIGVSVITWITIRYTATQLRGRNIINTIRAGGGV